MPRRRDTALLAAFGLAVRRMREDLGLSQEALAEAADLHRTYVGDVERGTRNVSLTNIARIAQALNSSPASLLEAASRLMRDAEGSA